MRRCASIGVIYPEPPCATSFSAEIAITAAARIYSPTLGRFLQIDPIGYEDQVNLYAYVGNDPVNMIDPDGKQMMITGPNPVDIIQTGERIIEAVKEDPGLILDGIAIGVDVATVPSGEAALFIAARQGVKQGVKANSKKAVAGTGRRAGNVKKATVKGVKKGNPKTGSRVKKSDAPKVAARGGRRGGVTGSKTQGSKFGKGKGNTSGRTDKGHQGGPTHNHPPKGQGKGGHWWWPF